MLLKNDTNFIMTQDLSYILNKTEAQHKWQQLMMKQIHPHTFLVLLTQFFFFSRKLLSSISNNKFPLIIYMQQQFPVKGENDQLFPGTISPM